jgi:hypothetical protein
MYDGGATKPESYCRIITYIQHNAPLLYENINDLCMFGVFNVRGNSGVTFLMPDKETQKRIDKTVGQDARKAVSMINACIIPIYLPSIDDFMANKDDIPNKLGQKLPIEKITSSTILLQNGSKITRDNKFKRLYDTSNIAVYLIDGEVPLDGEASNSLGKKRGAYSGGNDDFDGDITRGKYGASLNSLVEEICAVACTRVSRGGIDHLTHLGISLLNWMDTQEGELKEFSNLLCKVHPISPLYVLFILPLLTESELDKWVNEPKEYNKKDKLKEFLTKGIKEYEDVEANVKSVNVMKLQATDICNQVINYAGDIQQKYLNSENFSRFGKSGPVCFKYWICLVSEFTFIYTHHYVKALQDKDVKTVKLIIDSFKRFVLRPAMEKKWVDALTLTNPKVNDALIQSKERFCTILSLFVSRRFFPMGCGNLNELAQIEDGETGGVMYGYDLAPNRIAPVSDNHITAKYWLRSIPE